MPKRVELKTPEQWAAIDGIVVMEPAGWNYEIRTADDRIYPKPLHEPISHEEFQNRAGHSTVMGANDLGT